jgi:SAM-dependent methyltransferase
VRGDAHELSEQGVEKFDWITILHALEHCHDPKRVLREARRALKKPHGRAFVIVPLEHGSVSVSGDHCLMFRTPGDLGGMMAECGFDVERVEVITKGSELLGIGRRQG